MKVDHVIFIVLMMGVIISFLVPRKVHSELFAVEMCQYTVTIETLPVRAQIILLAREHDVPTELALAVAKCESGFVANAQNTRSTAGGVYQYLDSTWAHYCTGEKYNATDNITCAMEMISEGGIGHWDASFSCHGHLAHLAPDG